MDYEGNINGAVESTGDSNTEPDGLFVCQLRSCEVEWQLTSRLMEVDLFCAASFCLWEVVALKASRVFWRVMAGRRGGDGMSRNWMVPGILYSWACMLVLG